VLDNGADPPTGRDAFYGHTQVWPWYILSTLFAKGCSDAAGSDCRPRPVYCSKSLGLLSNAGVLICHTQHCVNTLVHLTSPYIHTLAIIKRSLFMQDWVRLFMVAFKPSLGDLSGKNSAEI